MKYQRRVEEWMRKVFDAKTCADYKERALRLVEEAIELTQSCGVPSESVHKMVDYVYSRPIGDPRREIAGVLTTTYAMAASIGADAEHELELELVRINRPEVIARVQSRQQEKREVTSLANKAVSEISRMADAMMDNLTPREREVLKARLK